MSTSHSPDAGLGSMRELGLAVLLAACFGTVMLDRMTQLFLGPYLVSDLHLRPGQIGLLAGVVSVCWAASTFVFGIVSDRIGRKRVLIPAMVLFSLLSWTSGLAHNFGQLLVIRALLGLAEGPCWSVIMALMEESSLTGRRGRNIGVVVCAGSLVGSAIGPVFATQIAERVGWQGAFFAAGVPGLLLAAAVAVLVREPPRPASGARASLDTMRTMLRLRGMWLCFGAALLLTIWIFAFNAFAPLFLTQTRGLSNGAAGLVLGASGFGGFLYCLAWPALSDRIGRRPAILFAAVIAVFLPLLFFLLKLDAVGYAVVAVLTSSGPALAALTMILVPVELAPRSAAGAAVGFVSIGGDAIGATAGPILGGLLAERVGLSAPLVLASAAAAGIVLLALGLRETRPGFTAATSDIAGRTT